ncbi:hypothetical protein T12_13891 [Trichinella patagoniensis]|uniref:Uncharacterized protein n=1 Tax=Trichinella patagoniensis TaxID=990121 RepID=A0A0V0ZQ31_9BILA|nr:hypothetical protein T12_13891 [Trichinella patagoniensis]
MPIHVYNKVLSNRSTYECEYARDNMQKDCVVMKHLSRTNFFNQFVKVMDWQAREMTMTGGSRVRIVRKPAQAARPSIGCARMH